MKITKEDIRNIITGIMNPEDITIPFIVAKSRQTLAKSREVGSWQWSLIQDNKEMPDGTMPNEIFMDENEALEMIDRCRMHEEKSCEFGKILELADNPFRARFKGVERVYA